MGSLSEDCHDAELQGALSTASLTRASDMLTFCCMHSELDAPMPPPLALMKALRDLSSEHGPEAC